MEDRYEQLYQKIKGEFPEFRIRRRRDTWARIPFRILHKITGVDYSRFLFTWWSTVYVGSSWGTASPNSKYVLLRHELVHVRQFHSFPLGRKLWILNHVLMPLLYLLALPVRWTIRARLEREAYTQSLLAEKEISGHLSEHRMEQNAKRLSRTFGGASYAWMWTMDKAYEWAMQTQHKINKGEIRNDVDRVDL